METQTGDKTTASIYVLYETFPSDGSTPTLLHNVATHDHHTASGWTPSCYYSEAKGTLNTRLREGDGGAYVRPYEPFSRIEMTNQPTPGVHAFEADSGLVGLKVSPRLSPPLVNTFVAPAYSVAHFLGVTPHTRAQTTPTTTPSSTV